MSTPYTPVNEEHETIDLPEDGFKATAELFNLPYRQIADRTEAALVRVGATEADIESIDAQLTGLNPRIAFQDEVNVFVEPQTIALDDAEDDPALTLNTARADVPLLASTSAPGDHPNPVAGGAGSTNKWKSLGRFERAGGTYAYLYTGADTTNVGGFGIVVNAYWDVDDQTWVQEDTANASSMLVWRFDKLVVLRKPSGSSTPWDNASWQNGRLDLQEVSATGDISANIMRPAHGVYSPDDYLYVNVGGVLEPYERISAIPLLHAFGEDVDFSPTSEGGVESLGNNALYWPLRLPHGATFDYLQVLIDQTDTPPAVVKLLRRDLGAGDLWDPLAPPSSASWTEIATATAVSPATPSKKVWTFNLGAPETCTTTKEYLVRVNNGVAVDQVLGLLVRWYDPGPRNF